MRLIVADALIVVTYLRCVTTHGTGVRKEGINTFTAAVYAHTPVVPNPLAISSFGYAKSIIQRNLDIYEKQAAIASEQGVKILVFPEDGLHGPFFSDRESISLYLEMVPDPGSMDQPYNPCDQYADNHSQIPAQYGLSCMAKKYSLYVAANTGTYVPCDHTLDPDCPPDGRYQYNTNIIFNPRGDLIGRYYKTTLFYEDQFDVPSTWEPTVIHTPFGKFGTFICFDVLFGDPAITVVEEHAVDGIIFPTAWGNKWPFMQAVGFHESWAHRMGVNFLSAEIHFPAASFRGSGLYAGASGGVQYYNDDGIFSEPKLVVAELPVSPPKPTFTTVPFPTEGTNFCGEFTAEMEGDVYTLSPLCANEGSLYLQEGNTKCHLSYKFQESHQSHPSDDIVMHALAIFDGLHTSAHNSYIQVCAVVSCSGQTACGEPHPSSVLTSLAITGQFSTPYVFPSVLFSDSRLNKSAWNFAMDREATTAKLAIDNNHEPLHTSVLYGRVYELDESPPHGEGRPLSGKANLMMGNQEEVLPASGVENDGIDPHFGLISAIAVAVVALTLMAVVVMLQARPRRGRYSCRSHAIDRTEYIRL